ncbi:hypothetical protein C3Z06_14265 [Cupriavidus metallidurans]|nr:hypothetical protein C3Z06_14265 [Cupriavidus metallidurans]
MTISFRIVKNSEPISLAEGSFAFMRLVLQQPARAGKFGSKIRREGRHRLPHRVGGTRRHTRDGSGPGAIR